MSTKENDIWNKNIQEIKLEERGRCIEIVKQYLNHSSHNPNDTCLENIIQEIQNI